MAFKYDIFISYSSSDRAWAERLEQSLTAKGIDCFRDQNRLDVGEPWEPQLARAVEQSRHLVVLWSASAEASPWVRRELGKFEAILDPDGTGKPVTDRRFIFVELEYPNRAFSSVQSVTALREAGAYAAGIEALDADLWSGVVDKIAGAIHNDDGTFPVPLVILSMTLDRLQQIDSTDTAEFSPSLDEFLQKIGIGPDDAPGERKKRLYPSYGARREDWRPFGSNQTVRQMLDALKDGINNKVDGPNFRWEPASDQFWTDTAVANATRDQLLSTFSVIVIDPVSLYDNRVFFRLSILSRCFDSDKVVVMVLTPFGLPAAIASLRSLIQERVPFLGNFFEPPVPRVGPFADCGPNIGDAREVRRVLRASLGQHVRSVDRKSPPGYLTVGGTDR